MYFSMTHPVHRYLYLIIHNSSNNLVILMWSSFPIAFLEYFCDFTCEILLGFMSEIALWPNWKGINFLLYFKLNLIWDYLAYSKENFSSNFSTIKKFDILVNQLTLRNLKNLSNGNKSNFISRNILACLSIVVSSIT